MNRPQSIDVPILMYHHIEQEAATSAYTISTRQFEAQLDWLRHAGFSAVGFRQLLGGLEGSGPTEPLPAKPVLITFDDGYESFREVAVPALLARQMRATVFVVAGEIGGSNRWDAAQGIPRRALMNEAGISEILAAGMEVGSHGWAHRDLTACSAEELDEEVEQSRSELEGRYGVGIQVFSYPYGRYSPQLVERLARAGYLGAVSIFSDAPTVTDNVYAMRRIYVHGGDSLWRFRCKLSPFYLRYAAWRAGRKR